VFVSYDVTFTWEQQDKQVFVFKIDPHEEHERRYLLDERGRGKKWA